MFGLGSCADSQRHRRTPPRRIPTEQVNSFLNTGKFKHYKYASNTYIISALISKMHAHRPFQQTQPDGNLNPPVISSQYELK